MKFHRLCALLLTITLLLSACGDAAGQVIRYDIPAGVTNLDPQFATDATARMIIANTFEGLFRQLPSGKIEACLAESYDVSPDGLTYTFHLRSGANWYSTNAKTRGRAVTAQDFAFALTRMFDPAGFSPFAGEFSCIRNASLILSGAAPQESLGVRAVDGSTLEISLNQPTPLLPELLAATYAMPCNEEFFRSTRARYGLEEKNLLYNGPFYLRDWNHKKALTLRRNPEYLLPAAESGGARTLVRGVDLYTPAYVQTQVPAGAAERFFKGETDLCRVDEPALSAGGAAGTLEPFEDTVWVLLLNQREEVFANADIRAALAHTVNREAMNGFLPENLRTTRVFIPPAIPWHGESYRAVAGEDSPVVYSPDLAKRYYTRGMEDLGRSSLPFNQILVCDEGNQQLLAGFIQQGIQRSLGIFAGLSVCPREEVLERVRTGNFQAAILPLTPAYSSPDAMLSLFRSDSGQNPAAYQSAEYDRLLTAQKQADSDAQLAGYHAAERFLLEEGVVIPLYFETSYYALSKQVSGIAVSPFLGSVYFRDACKE